MNIAFRLNGKHCRLSLVEDNNHHHLSFMSVDVTLVSRDGATNKGNQQYTACAHNGPRRYGQDSRTSNPTYFRHDTSTDAPTLPMGSADRPFVALRQQQ